MSTSIGRRNVLKMLGAGAAATCTTFPMPAVAQPVTVKIMTWGGPDRYTYRFEQAKRLYPGLESKFNIEVVSPGPTDTPVYRAVRLALSSGEPLPDLVQMNYIGVPEFVESGALANLGTFMEPYSDGLTPAAKKLSSYNGESFAIPYQLKPKVWFYRKDLFDKAKISPDSIKTFEDYMAAAERYRSANSNSFIMNIGSSPIHWWYFMLLSHWEDVVVADREGNFKITEDPHFGQVMDWLKAWSTSGIAFPTEDFSPDWQPGFASGAIGGVLSGNWLMSFLPKFAPEQKGLWGMTQFPDFNDRGSEAGGGVMVIPEGSVQKEAAFELAAKMFLEVPGSLSELAYTGAPPVIAAAEARRAEALGRPQGMSDEEWNITPQGFFGDDFLEPTLESLKKFDVFNYDPGAQAELDLMRRETEAYISGAKTRDQALRDLEQSMESQIGNPFEI